MIAPKQKAPERANARGPMENNTDRPDSNSRSTSTKSQHERIIGALRARPHTSYELRRLGCYQAPARIKELRDRFGYEIHTARVTVVDRDGYLHQNVALYTLMSEPECSDE